MRPLDELAEQTEREHNRRFGMWLLALLVLFVPAIIYALPAISGPFWIFVAPVVCTLLACLIGFAIQMARTGRDL